MMLWSDVLLTWCVVLLVSHPYAYLRTRAASSNTRRKRRITDVNPSKALNPLFVLSCPFIPSPVSRHTASSPSLRPLYDTLSLSLFHTPMPSSILSRFKKSPSNSTKLDLDNSGDNNALSPTKSGNRRSPSPFRNNSDLSFNNSTSTYSTEVSPTSRARTVPGQEHGHDANGSHFVEEFNEGVYTPDGRARGFTLPALGTPKLTLTEDGASSPVSFGSSPHSQNKATHFELRKRPSHERLGLGIGSVDEVSLDPQRENYKLISSR
jgi:hypothetical protein